jgi:hypothetical protein
MPSKDFYVRTQDGCLSKHNQFFVCTLPPFRISSVEIIDISKLTVALYRSSKSVSAEASITFPSGYRYCADSAETALLSLHDTRGASQQQLEEAKIMNLGGNWIDWSVKLDTEPISSALDRAIISKWDALDAYDSWAGVEGEYMVIEDPALPQDHSILSAHTDHNHSSSSSLSFEVETRLRRIAMPGSPPTFLSSLDPALCNPNGEGPDPLSPHHLRVLVPHKRTHKRQRKQPPTSQLRMYQGQGHNAADRKYRNNLNSKPNTLRL